MKIIRSIIAVVAFGLSACAALAGWEGRYYYNNTDTAWEVEVYVDLYDAYDAWGWPLGSHSGVVARTIPAYSSVDFREAAASDFFGVPVESVSYEYYDLVSDYPVTPIPMGSLSATCIALGESITFYRNGISTRAGFGWTEATLWKPDYYYAHEVLGNHSCTGTTDTITPTSRGEHSIQFRYVDANYAYRDQWLTFVVY